MAATWGSVGRFGFGGATQGKYGLYDISPAPRHAQILRTIVELPERPSWETLQALVWLMDGASPQAIADVELSKSVGFQAVPDKRRLISAAALDEALELQSSPLQDH